MDKSFFKNLQSKRENLNYVIGVGLAILLAVVMVEQPPGASNRQSKESLLKLRARHLVNKNLRADDALKHLREKAVEQEHQAMLEKRLQFDPEGLESERYEAIDPSVHDGSPDVYDDIYGSQAVYDSSLDPSERIEVRIQKMKMLEEYDYQQKLAYIEAFVESAYEKGYQVELNEDLEVVKVKKINNKGPYRGSASLSKLLEY